MQYPEITSVAVEQAWPEPGSLKPRGGHHLEPQGSRAYSSAVPRVISFLCVLKSLCVCAAVRILRCTFQHLLQCPVRPRVNPPPHPQLSGRHLDPHGSSIWHARGRSRRRKTHPPCSTACRSRHPDAPRTRSPHRTGKRSPLYFPPMAHRPCDR